MKTVEFPGANTQGERRPCTRLYQCNEATDRLGPSRLIVEETDSVEERRRGMILARSGTNRCDLHDMKEYGRAYRGKR